jgi:hypothetical protein
MAGYEFPDIPLRDRFLLVGVGFGPASLGRFAHDKRTVGQEIPDRPDPFRGRERAEPRDVFENNLGLARKAEQKVDR